MSNVQFGDAMMIIRAHTHTHTNTFCEVRNLSFVSHSLAASPAL